CAGTDRPMETALGADLEVFLEFGPVEHGAAAVALLPQPFGHAALAGRAGLGADVRRHQLLQPGHAWRRIRWRRSREGAQSSARAEAAKDGPGRARPRQPAAGPSPCPGPQPAAAGKCGQSSAARSGARNSVARAAASAGSAACAIADTSALPTTTPSASTAMAAALAASRMPKPATTGTGLPARIRRRWAAAASGSRRSDAPVTPAKLT